MNLDIKTADLMLRTGQTIELQDPGDRLCIVIGGAGIDEDGNYRTSDWEDTIEECYQGLGKDCGFPDLEKSLKEYNYMGTRVIEYDLVPAGTMVKILDNAKEICEKHIIGWTENMKEMIGEVCKIKGNSGSGYRIWRKDKSNWWLFPRQAFIVATEQPDDEVEKAIKLLEDRGKLKDGKVII